MIQHPQKKILSCLRRTMLVGLMSSLGGTTAALAQDTNATVMKPVVITGSYIPTAETVGPAPVETINAVDIEKVGATDVLDLVKRVSSAFSGNGNLGQTVNNGGFGEAYIAIRNLPTLVMFNGRRLGNSSFSNGAIVDLNTLPLSMIERIEILNDGSSTIYGTQAIGDEIYIIT